MTFGTSRTMATASPRETFSTSTEDGHGPGNVSLGPSPCPYSPECVELLVVSGFETLDQGSGVVDRLQFYEFYDASNELLAKRALPMRFALIDRSEFTEAAQEAV